MPYINDFVRDTGFGDGTGKLKIDDEGTLHLEGDATVWDDIVGSLIGKTISSTAGKVDYNWAENSITMQSGGSITTQNDCIVFSVQVPHAAKVDGTLDLHMHWEQDTAVAREITVKHRVQNNGDAKTTTWTTTVVSTDADSKFAYTSGTINQISDLVSVDLTGVGISGVVQFQIARTDSETGDLEATFIDCHVELDTLGSKEEYTK